MNENDNKEWKDHSLRGYIERMTSEQLFHIIRTHIRSTQCNLEYNYLEDILDVLEKRCKK